jgi:hypothetical protein
VGGRRVLARHAWANMLPHQGHPIGHIQPGRCVSVSLFVGASARASASVCWCKCTCVFVCICVFVCFKSIYHLRADIHWALSFKLDPWFIAKERGVPVRLIYDVRAIQEKLRTHMDYGEHPAMYLAAMLDPK